MQHSCLYVDMAIVIPNDILDCENVVNRHTGKS